MRLILKIFGLFLFKFNKLTKKALNLYLQDYYRKRIKTGVDVFFNGTCRITGMENIEIGDNVHIGDNAFIRAEGGLFIGDNVHIARNLVLYTHNHNYLGERLPYDDNFIYKKVIIERNVWVGINVTILPGTHIKEGAIIGAGSVVYGTVEKLSIYGACPANLIKMRDEKHYNNLDQQKKYGGISGKPLKDI